MYYYIQAKAIQKTKWRRRSSPISMSIKRNRPNPRLKRHVHITATPDPPIIVIIVIIVIVIANSIHRPILIPMNPQAPSSNVDATPVVTPAASLRVYVASPLSRIGDMHASLTTCM